MKAGKPDPLGDLIRGVGEGVAKIVGDLERSLQKLVDPKVLLTSNNIASVVGLKGFFARAILSDRSTQCVCENMDSPIYTAMT